MIDGISEICIDCVHQEVCRYDCYSPSEHCNDRAVVDDFIPQGEWIMIKNSDGNLKCYECSKCGKNQGYISNYCEDCGAKMKGGTDMRNDEKETTFDDYLKEQLKDPEFRKEWEKLQDEDMHEDGEENDKGGT